MIEGAAGKEDASDVPKPGPEHLLVGSRIEEVILKRPVLRPEAPCGGLRLLRVPGEIKLLVVRLLKRAIPGGNGVIGAGLDADVVGRVGVDQVNRGALEEPVDVLGLRGVATKETVAAKGPEVPGASH